MEQNIIKKDHYNFLYAYYNPLLTQKQREIFESYYYDDFSLSEISESLQVSRNAVWDVLKKVEHNLDEYESKLGLYQKNQELNKLLDELEIYVNPKGLTTLNKIKEME